jgi:hypothetical protein
MTRIPAFRAASSTALHGSMARASLDTSFPSISPNPPGSKKSLCIVESTAHFEVNNNKWQRASDSSTTVKMKYTSSREGTKKLDASTCRHRDPRTTYLHVDDDESRSV